MRTTYAEQPTLPFVLLERPQPEASGMVVIVERLDALQGLVEDARLEIRELVHVNSELLHRLSASPAAPEVPEPASAAVEDPKRAAPRVSIRLLGAFEVRVGDAAVQGWRSRKARQVLAYLALHRERAVQRDALIEAFWPDSAPARGANNLSIAVHHIRSRLAPLIGGEQRGLAVRQGTYSLDPEVGWDVDAVTFGSLVESAREALAREAKDEARAAMERAAELYGGEFLESDAFEEWTIEPRRALAEQHTSALTWLATDAAEREDWHQLAHYGQTLLRVDPYDELAHRWLIRAYGRIGDRSRALRQYRECEARLREEFGVEPSDETRALLRDLLDRPPR